MARGPVPDKPAHHPRVPEVQRLIDAYYQFEQCAVGGDLHIVLNDRNWDDSTIQWCMDHAGEYGDREPECAKLLGRLLLLITKTQRGRLDAGYGGKAMTRPEFIATANEILLRGHVDNPALRID